MYLLQSDASALGMYFVSFIIGLAVLYLIVKAAVYDGTKDLKTQLRLQNNLRLEEMRKNGFTEEELAKAFEKTKLKG